MINPAHIKYLLIKEMLERKIRHIIGFVLLSITCALFFISRFFGLGDNFTDVISAHIPFYQNNYPAYPDNQLSLIIYIDIFFPVFILIPAISSPFLGVLESVIREKENRTLEGLLSLPLSDSEILIGKMAASIIGGICHTWFIFILHLGFFLFCQPSVFFFHLLTTKWMTLVLVLSPIISYAVNAMGMIPAIWLKKINTAGNLGAVILSPLFFFIILISLGKIILDVNLILVLSIGGLITGSVLLFVTFHIFNREKLLFRYY